MRVSPAVFTILALCLIAIFVPQSADAQRKRDFRDSLDFLLDDGEMTPDEMEEEAIGIYNRCAGHLIRNQYYDCECIAGAFLERREEVGPYMEQFILLNEVYTETPQCVNDAKIAGTSYNECKNGINILRPKETDDRNEDYCECVGRESAKQFALNPSMRKRAMIDTRTNAIMACNQEYPVPYGVN